MKEHNNVEYALTRVGLVPGICIGPVDDAAEADLEQSVVAEIAKEAALLAEGIAKEKKRTERKFSSPRYNLD